MPIALDSLVDTIGTNYLTHEFMKRLHARFSREGIETNYPVRKLGHASADGALASLSTKDKL